MSIKVADPAVSAEPADAVTQDPKLNVLDQHLAAVRAGATSQLHLFDEDDGADILRAAETGDAEALIWRGVIGGFLNTILSDADQHAKCPACAKRLRSHILAGGDVTICVLISIPVDSGELLGNAICFAICEQCAPDRVAAASHAKACVSKLVPGTRFSDIAHSPAVVGHA